MTYEIFTPLSSDEIYQNTISLGHKICGNGSCCAYSTRVIQYKLATEFEALFHILGTGNLVFLSVTSYVKRQSGWRIKGFNLPASYYEGAHEIL